MNLTHTKWATLLPILLVAVVILGVAAAKSNTSSVETSVHSETTGPSPVRLSIPSIHVDAQIETVGLTPLGSVEVPKNPANAAWFDRSVRPGEVGSSVIDGHYGWKNGGKAVFDDLSKLRVGDEINVQDSTGITTYFVIRKIKTVAANDIVPDIFISNDGKAHLNLITCEGTWNKAAHSYSERLVIYADKWVKGG